LAALLRVDRSALAVRMLREGLRGVVVIDRRRPKIVDSVDPGDTAHQGTSVENAA
jgi:hypothetical protein